MTEADENAAVELALAILAHRFQKRDVFRTPDEVKKFAILKLGSLEYEVFAVFFLDAHNGLIAYEEMFRGTLTQTSVYPREIVRQALKHNAAAVILCHPHPSGVCEPSRADEALTQTLKAALALVDVRVLDHLVVTQVSAISFAEKGLL